MKGNQKSKGRLSKRDLNSYQKRLMEDGNLIEKLSREELDGVASDLTNPDDLYQRVRILAKSFDPRYIPVFEKLATYADDTMVAGEALRALIDFHGRHEYLPLLMKYIEGVNWDPYDDLKLHSIGIAEFLLKEHKDQELIALVIKQFEESDNSVVRDAAHEALMTAAGIDRSDVSTTIAARGMTEDDLRLDVIARLKKGQLPN
ncbi:hypothetical protein [Aestuariivirga sp.]|uniref:hypothetical protein n=1 Tax=Aestuariivirga sp. TaxID=2650926 RepID=UPI003593437C